MNSALRIIKNAECLLFCPRSSPRHSGRTPLSLIKKQQLNSIGCRANNTLTGAAALEAVCILFEHIVRFILILKPNNDII